MGNILRALPLIGGYFAEEEKETIVPPTDFPPAKVAIIGGGVGGCTAAYFIREQCGSSVDISVFNDTEVVGGRCAVIEFDGNNYESGASIIHTSNKYLVDLRKKFGLKEFNSSKVPTTPKGIFDGKSFVLSLGFCSIVNNIKMLLKYGLSLLRMSRTVHSLVKKFSNIYTLQAKGQAYNTVPDMLRAIMDNVNDTFYNQTQFTGEQYFKNELGWNEALVNDLICAAVKVIYGQNNEIDAFAGFVALAGIDEGYLWSVIGGNYQIPLKALKASNATYIVSKVTDVTLNTDNTYTVSSEKMTASFDVVIIAHPLNLSNIKFNNFSNPIYTHLAKTPYHRTVATFVKGEPNPQFFGYPGQNYPRNFPLAILTNNMEGSPVDFNSLVQVIPATIDEKEARKYAKPLKDLPTQVFKVFSQSPLTESDLSKLFCSIDSVAVKDWLAYPQYDPPEQFPPFVLDGEGLLYINCIEKAASAMELSVIAAKNVALLTRDYILRTV